MVFVAGKPKHLIAYMKDFLFAPEQAGTPIGALSGGERGRLMVARALAQPSNLLVLDEPTNDLDLETLDLFQEMLDEYSGTVLLVSHDRDFLDRVVTSVIAFEGAGRWVEYAGGYSDMIAQRGGATKAAKQTTKTGKAKSAASTASPDSPSAPGRKRKMSFKDEHAHKILPARIQALESEITRLQAVLADPGFYARDPDAFARAAAELEAAGADLAAAEDRWLTLEMLRDELGNG
jgi:ATP-binding cassette subfamily F protein uup